MTSYQTCRFTFLKTSKTEALSCPFSTCSSDRKACLVPSELDSTSASLGRLLLLVVLLVTEPLAWPFSLPFSAALLSAIKYPHVISTVLQTLFYSDSWFSELWGGGRLFQHSWKRQRECVSVTGSVFVWLINRVNSLNKIMCHWIDLIQPDCEGHKC